MMDSLGTEPSRRAGVLPRGYLHSRTNGVPRSERICYGLWAAADETKNHEALSDRPRRSGRTSTW
jgi:hypothetical protein